MCSPSIAEPRAQAGPQAHAARSPSRGNEIGPATRSAAAQRGAAARLVIDRRRAEGVSGSLGAGGGHSTPPRSRVLPGHPLRCGRAAALVFSVFPVGEMPFPFPTRAVI